MLDLTAISSIIKNTGAYGALAIFGYYVSQAMANGIISSETGIVGLVCCMILITAVYMSSDRQRLTNEAIQETKAVIVQQTKTNQEVVAALQAVTAALNLNTEQRQMLDRLGGLAEKLETLTGEKLRKHDETD